MHILVYQYYRVMDTNQNYEYRKIQALIGETSFSVILPKTYVTNLCINKGDFVKVHQEDNKIVIEKA